ncbi:transmembrane protein 220 isoform X1 [Tachyglossus aculeatus]|uniref:transmembrane protein 220 isoform X1 n=1 Tax=Tachyglossus aculeatus TaxID=9261 RepID=UPI0018F794A5|nr:transmembrane protein 220 isoform X1 [Tachyglossus aculeatus]
MGPAGPGGPALWRGCNLLMAAFLALAASVQVNDPDAGLWMVAYAVPALLSLLVGLSPQVAGNAIWRRLTELHLLLCVAGAIWSGGSWARHTHWDLLNEEEGRELFGLLIVAMWMSLCHSSAKSPVGGGARLAVAVSIALCPVMLWAYIYVNKEMRASWPAHCKEVL